MVAGWARGPSEVFGKALAIVARKLGVFCLGSSETRLAKFFTSGYHRRAKAGGEPISMRERSGGSGGPGRLPDERPDAIRDHGQLAGLGITMGLSIALFALGGNWLDGRLGTKPLFVLLGAFLGFGGGFYSMYARLVVRRRDQGPGPDE
jgi:hypothetical protein